MRLPRHSVAGENGKPCTVTWPGSGDGPHHRHYLLFCVLERDGAAVGLAGPSVVLITGKDKAFLTLLSKPDYAEVRALGGEYRKRVPRSVLK